MAHFVDDIHHRTSTRLGDIVPQFIQEQYPQFFAFVKAYFQFLEQSDTNPITPVYVPQTGVITILSGNSVVSGSGTTFTLVDRGADTDATLAQYDRIKVDTEYFTIRSVTNNTSLTLLDIPDRNFFGKSYAVETQKSVRQAAGALRQILTFHEVDQTIPDFIAYFQNTYLRDFPQQGTDTAKLVPSILNFYQSRGSEESFQFLFRALFGQEIKITYPRDYTFGTSDAVYERPTVLRVSGVPPQTIYQINTASSTATFANGEIIRASNSSVTNLGQGTVYRTINATAVEVVAVIGNVRTNPGYAVTLTGLTSGATRTLSGNGVDTNTNTVGLIFGSSITGNVYSLENREIVGLTSNVRARVSQVRESREGTNYVLTLSLEEVLRNDVPFSVLLNSSNVADDGDRLVLTSAGIPPAQNEREIYPSFFAQEQKPDVVFQYGERISTLPLTDPLRIQANVLGTVVGFNVLSGGSGFNIGDLIYVPYSTPTINGYGAIGKVIGLSTSQISSVAIDDSGEGYYTGIPLLVDNSGTGGGSGLEGYVSAITAGQLILHADPANANGVANGDILVFTVEDPLNVATPFVYKSGLEAVNYYEEGLSLSELLSWKVTLDTPTASADTLAAEGYTYLSTNTAANNFVREETITASYAITANTKFTVNTTSNIMSVVSGTSADLYAGLQISIANGSATVQATVSEITNSTSVQLTTVPATAVTSGNVSIVGSAVIATTEVTTGTFTIASGNTTLTAATGNTQGLLAYVPYQLSNGVASIQLTLRSITNATSAELTTATATAVTAGTAYRNVLNATALMVREVTGSFVTGATLTGSTSTHTRIQTNVASSVSLSLEPPQFGYADWGMGIESSQFYNDSAVSIIEPKLLETTIVPFYINGIRTAVGEIETITITGTGTGYLRRSPDITLPEPVLPRTAAGELLTRAIVPYRQATLSATISAGAIAAVKTVTGGSGYAGAGAFTVNSSSTSSKTGNNAVLQLIVGAQVDGEPRFKTSRSLTSSIQHLQDESTYQPFSYVLSVDADYTQYADVVRRLVHPAGGKLLPERAWTTGVANSGLREFETLRRSNYLFSLEESATANITTSDVKVHLVIPGGEQPVTSEISDVTVHTRVTVPTTEQVATLTVPAQFQAYQQQGMINVVSTAATATYAAGGVDRSAGINTTTVENANVKVVLVFKPDATTVTTTAGDVTQTMQRNATSGNAPDVAITAGTSTVASGEVVQLSANNDINISAPGVRFTLVFDVLSNDVTMTAPTTTTVIQTTVTAGNAPVITTTPNDIKANQSVGVNVGTGIIASYGPDAINVHGTETIESTTAAQSETTVILAPTVTVATTTP